MTRKIWLSIAIIGLFGSLVSQSAAQTIWYVDGALETNGDGQTWETAFNNLQSALSEATADQSPRDQIWVATQTYKPQLPAPPADPRTAIFEIPSGVEVYGGFVSGDDELGDRRPDLHPTVLSGDIGDPGVASDNCRCVVRITQEFTASVMDGFSIIGGTGGYWESCGAGVFVDPGSGPTIANCRIADCAAEAWGAGGGMYVDVGGRVDLSNVTFANCRAGAGAGLYLAGGEVLISLDHCDFLGNIAIQHSGGLYNACTDNVTVRNSRFIANSALQELGGAAGATNSVNALASFTNCLFSNNVGLRDGAALWNGSGSSVNLVNCTIANNTSSCGLGGGLYIGGGSTTVTNSVLWGNSDHDSSGTTESAQIHVATGGACTVTYTCIQGMTVFNDQTNIGADPQFRDANGPDNLPGTLDDDFRLNNSPFSPAIDAGYDNAINESSDLDGVTRKINALSNPALVDMGAYEYQGAFTDCNRNGIDDLAEVPYSPGCQAGTCVSGCAEDANQNCVPDECDIASGTSHDCNGNGVPDENEDLWPDCNGNCVPDATETDENGNGIPDVCEYSVGHHWTTNSDFDAGLLINVNHDAASGKLQRNPVQETQSPHVPGISPLPYIWVAASGRGTVLRVRTENEDGGPGLAGDILGEYHTAPEMHLWSDATTCAPWLRPGQYPNPSRSTIDLDSAAWVANRADDYSPDDYSDPTGSATKFGLVLGGERVNAQGAHDDDGGYLKPPFLYCNCEDRDGDGLIRTSRRIGDILPWDNKSGVDDMGGVSTAEDECILRYVRTAGQGTRTLAIDNDNNLWCGGSANYAHEQLNGYSGASLQGTLCADGCTCGGYGGVVVYWPEEPSGILWSSSGSGSLLKGPFLDTWSCISFPRTVYGIGVDLEGDLWISHYTVASVSEYTRAGVIYGPYSTGEIADNRGVAVTLADNNVWVANTNAASVSRLAQNGAVRTVVDLNGDGQGTDPTGVAIDRRGKVWASCRGSSTLKRIDPAGDQQYPLGKVDLTVDLGDGASPYNYSDMTGLVGLHTTGTGTWIVTHDGQKLRTEWCRVIWNEEPNCPGQPEGTDLQVSVRASDNEAQLANQDYTLVPSSGAPLNNIIGRFIQVRVRFFATVPGVSPYETPVLCDLEVIPTPECVKGDVNADGYINLDDIPPFVLVALDNEAHPVLVCPADMNKDGKVNGLDIQCFVDKLISGSCVCDTLPDCGSRGGNWASDCNGNGIPDARDLLNGAPDCNHNEILDECDIDPNDPDGNGLVSNDLNANGIPDECEPDCNKNGVPDDKDIADQTSNDVNSNGIPDECEKDCNNNGIPDSWDISQSASPDCNANGIPDECEFDCNNNGVPDDCDIDPSDPDGDQIVWPDCNTNGLPDACDFNLPPPFGSLDCNDNGIPDECDIANCPSNDPSCQDCNANGILDGCDIAAQVSLDEDEDGIPDECEEGSRMGGEMMQGEGLFGGDPQALEEAWAAYWDWARDQTWGPNSEYTGAEQYQRLVAKLQELGLPLSILTP